METYQHILNMCWTESAACSDFSTGSEESSQYLEMREHLTVTLTNSYMFFAGKSTEKMWKKSGERIATFRV